MISAFRKLACFRGSLLAAILASLAGCGQGPETVYGSSRGASLNGTSGFAELLRRQGHEVRTAHRLTEELRDWAKVIVRFAAVPGPPSALEGDWYREWLSQKPESALVYIVRDYDAEPDYWLRVADRLGSEGNPQERTRAEKKAEEAANWVSRLPARATKSADPSTWFAVGPAQIPPSRRLTVSGPWSEGLQPRETGISLHEPLRADGKEPLLLGDGKVLAMEWEIVPDGWALVIANGSFLLNLPLVDPARRPLAARVADWIGSSSRRIAFVDGPSPLGEPESSPSLIDLVARISSFRWIAIHLGLLGLLASLARAPRLGRPRVEPPSDEDRPVAHAEALGTLLERSRDAALARHQIEIYREWREGRQ